MTDHSEFLAEPMSHEATPTKSVTLNLPIDLLEIIHRQAQQTGQSRSVVLIEALRKGLPCSSAGSLEPQVDQHPATAATELQVEFQAEFQAELQAIATRLTALESLAQRVTALENKLELTEEVERSPTTATSETDFFPSLEDNPVPANSQPAEAATPAPTAHCPRCDYRLGAPLKTSGRQICGKCGWSDKPRQSAPAASEVANDDLKKLLMQAASDSLNNMKPKTKAEPQSGINIRQLPFLK